MTTIPAGTSPWDAEIEELLKEGSPTVEQLRREKALHDRAEGYRRALQDVQPLLALLQEMLDLGFAHCPTCADSHLWPDDVEEAREAVVKELAAFDKRG